MTARQTCAVPGRNLFFADLWIPELRPVNKPNDIIIHLFS
jgi:hypothetical protein